MGYTNETKKLILTIKQGMLSEESLVENLHNDMKYVVSNSIIMIVKKQFNSQLVVDGLCSLLSKFDEKDVFFNGITLGHLALAALGLMDTNKIAQSMFKDYYDKFNQNDKEKLDYVMEFLRNELKDSVKTNPS